MDRDWVLQTRETRRAFASATWVPLRALVKDEQGDFREVGYVEEYFGCGTAAFPQEHREVAESLGWSDLGIGRDVEPYSYDDGYYSPIEVFQYNDKDPVGINLVFDHPQPVVGGRRWIINPDLIVALKLVREGDSWVRPEEDFVTVIREIFEPNGDHRLIEIKREFLLDYLAARNLNLRMAYYRQRVENVASLAQSSYAGMETHEEARNEGRFELLIRDVNDVFGGSWSVFRAWRTDVDDGEDAPQMGPETSGNTASEQGTGERGGYSGVRVEGEFWKEEWISHQGRSTRVRRDADTTLPSFIVSTDGTRVASKELRTESIGCWLWFGPGVVSALLGHRGFSLEWYTAETGGIVSTSGCRTHFGINSSDFVSVYAYDIAKLAAWEQHIWAAYTIVPEGKMSPELYSAHVLSKVAETHAPEVLLLEGVRLFGDSFKHRFKMPAFTTEVNDKDLFSKISRFASRDQPSLLTLAKELVRLFTDRLDVRSLRDLSKHPDRDRLGSNKLLQDILSQFAGTEKAREIYGPIVGAYDMRLGDAHPTSSKIADALKLAGVDESASPLRQGEQLIYRFGMAIWEVGRAIFLQDASAASGSSSTGRASNSSV